MSDIFVVVLVVEVVLSNVELLGEVLIVSFVDFLDQMLLIDPYVLFDVPHHFRGAFKPSAQDIFRHLLAGVDDVLQLELIESHALGGQLVDNVLQNDDDHQVHRDAVHFVAEIVLDRVVDLGGVLAFSLFENYREFVSSGDVQVLLVSLQS